MTSGVQSLNSQVQHVRTLENRLPDIPGLAGAIAGFGGGAAMIVVAAMLSMATGQDMWREPREIAAPFLGGVMNGSAAVLLGTVLHFLMAGLICAGYGILSRRILRLPSDFGVPVLMGMIYGLMVWAIAYFFVVPALNPALLDTYAPSFVIQHLVYGMVTGLIHARLRPAPYIQSAPERGWGAMLDQA